MRCHAGLRLILSSWLAAQVASGAQVYCRASNTTVPHPDVIGGTYEGLAIWVSDVDSDTGRSSHSSLSSLSSHSSPSGPSGPSGASGFFGPLAEQFSGDWFSQTRQLSEHSYARPVRIQLEHVPLNMFTMYSGQLQFMKDSFSDEATFSLQGMLPTSNGGLVLTSTISATPRLFISKDRMTDIFPYCHLTATMQRFVETSDLEDSDEAFLSPPDAIMHLTAFGRCGKLAGNAGEPQNSPDAQYSDDSTPAMTATAVVALRKLDEGATYAKQSKIAILLIAKSTVEVASFVIQAHLVDSARAGLKIAPLFLWLQILLDSFECEMFFLIHNRNSAFWVSTLFSLALVGLIKVLLVLIGEVRWLIQVWKVRAVARLAAASGNESLLPHLWIREVAVNIRWLAIFLVSGVIAVSLVFDWVPEITVLLLFGFVPQICENIYGGIRGGLSTWFIVLVSACRFVCPWLIWSQASNPAIQSVSAQQLLWPTWFAGPLARDKPREFAEPVFGGLPRRPNSAMVFAAATVLITQVVWLLLQKTFHARVGLPNWLLQRLPEIFDYVEDVQRVSALRQQVDPMAPNSEDCVICMGTVKFKDRDCVVTPCQHFFHTGCLQRWMEVKLECPTCRRVLPSF